MLEVVLIRFFLCTVTGLVLMLLDFGVFYGFLFCAVAFYFMLVFGWLLLDLGLGCWFDCLLVVGYVGVHLFWLLGVGWLPTCWVVGLCCCLLVW